MGAAGGEVDGHTSVASGTRCGGRLEDVWDYEDDVSRAEATAEGQRGGAAAQGWVDGCCYNHSIHSPIDRRSAPAFADSGSQLEYAGEPDACAIARCSDIPTTFLYQDT